MPNRIIKESICTSENLNELTLEEEVFFYRLITQCDDFGRMDARPQILRAKCFPLRTDTVKLADVENWLNSLVKQELIILYTVDDKRYLQMVTWDKHQQKRAKRSKYPAPDDGNIVLQSPDIKCNQSPAYVPEKREYENTRNEYENREPDFNPAELERGRSQVFECFEKGFGRPINPIESEQLLYWLEHFTPELILKALEIAVLSNNRSFKYINGILRNWGDNGVKCVEDVDQLERKHRALKDKNRASPARPNKCETTGQEYEIYVPPALAGGL